jgi:hypothetical protein
MPIVHEREVNKYVCLFLASRLGEPEIAVDVARVLCRALACNAAELGMGLPQAVVEHVRGVLMMWIPSFEGDVGELFESEEQLAIFMGNCPELSG